MYRSGPRVTASEMGKCLLLALGAASLHAASIQGTVVENQTGKPLARALIVLEPVAGTAAESTRIRTNQYGAFQFAGLAEGSYLITASRRGFAAVQYGQKRWKAAGMPIHVGQNGPGPINIALPRLGAITGVVADENDVGLPEHDVVAYRAARPLELAGRGRTDDRGRYRISSLEPGRYLVRSVAKQYEDGGYLPTFYRETQRIDSAVSVDVELDQQIDYVNLRPLPGRLFVIRGQVLPPAQVNVTLLSDTGAETTVSDGAGSFQFNPVARGQYEIYAQAAGEQRSGLQAAYQSLVMDRDRTDVRLSLRSLPDVQFLFFDIKGQRIDLGSVQIMARRKDLAGTGKTQVLELPGERVEFLPGRWELAMASRPEYYVAGFGRNPRPDGRRADGWNEVLISGSEVVQFILSSNPAALHGTVVGPGHIPMAGAPVYLELYDPQLRRRLKDLQVTRTDLHGRYVFAGLAPGSYRLLSSFNFEAPEGSMELPGARTLNLEERMDLLQDLELSDAYR